MEINKESLEVAIKDFNEWQGSASLKIDKNDGEFFTDVYLNDIHKISSYSEDNIVTIISRDERETLNIGEKRREYIIKFCELLYEGWAPFQIDYQLEK